ncbi:sugar phosphate isomerase/epimerase family protein [Bifidobacterium simiarum]|uniref:sugar phosphate isomerase/epimerase family protein n=1 Tax=Bifidobacterium simiarum TaxID=2045441 RepID=UPI001BDD532C|nr:sugar phosphate isomerase/epimerase [Bifidobacterium simiarum]MBT1166368.1 sugar phosphate isomerase/epimerase [Bifidobacterium simiarum]
MKLGLLSAILDGYDFESMVDTASSMGFKTVEVACWPVGKAERRYAGVSHINVDELTDEKAEYYLNYCANRGVEIAALGYYPNPLDADEAKSQAAIAHIYKLIDASVKLKVYAVNTFIGRNQHLSVEENLELVRKVWPAIVDYAQERGVRIGIENCPMLFGQDQWPGGQNLMTTPEIWRKVFEIIPNENFGIEFDPSHFVWQMMDYIQPIYEFKDRIFHIHFKDIKLLPERLKQVGVMAYPLDYMKPKIPGLGDIDWGAFVSALTDIGYEGSACIEIEDKAFEGSDERVLDSIRQAKRYMDQFVS